MSYSDTCDYCGEALCTQCGQHLTDSLQRAVAIDRAAAFERTLDEIALGEGIGAEIARKALSDAEKNARAIREIDAGHRLGVTDEQQ